jgi:hypothetical protein
MTAPGTGDHAEDFSPDFLGFGVQLYNFQVNLF